MSSGYKILKLQSAIALKACVDLYLHSPYGIDPSSMTDPALCLNNIRKVGLGDNGAVIGAYKDSHLVAFMLIRKGLSNLHSPDISLMQEYYVTSLTGFSAARILVLMHNELERLGREQGVNSVKSHASHLDNEQVLCKILEKAGWSRCGYVVFKRLRDDVRNSRLTLATSVTCDECPTG